LLREIGGAVGVCHGAGGKEEELAEVAFIQRQTGHFPGGEMFAPLAWGEAASLCDRDAMLLPFGARVEDWT